MIYAYHLPALTEHGKPAIEFLKIVVKWSSRFENKVQASPVPIVRLGVSACRESGGVRRRHYSSTGVYAPVIEVSVCSIADDMLDGVPQATKLGLYRGMTQAVVR